MSTPTNETPATRTRWLADRRTTKKSRKDPWSIVTLGVVLIFFTIFIGGFVAAIRTIDHRGDKVRNSLIANTRGHYGKSVFIRTADETRASFSIFDGACIYSAKVVKAKNGERTLVSGSEKLTDAKVTIKADTAVAAICPAKPISSDFERLVQGG